jgi:hypothetical protein
MGEFTQNYEIKKTRTKYLDLFIRSTIIAAILYTFVRVMIDWAAHLPIGF